MPVATINGHPLYFEETGSGPPVVFSHGFLMDHDMFAPQVEALAGEFRCITWDERGFGQTPAGAPVLADCSKCAQPDAGLCVFCNCNGQKYSSLSTCINDCKATLACSSTWAE